MSNVKYTFTEDGVGCGEVHDGTAFLFDAEDFDRIKDINWYRNLKNGPKRLVYIINQKGEFLHRYVLDVPSGYEVDHISCDTMDNRKCNLRVCTHQQNQCNQPLQCNNTSGVSGVSYYSRRSKYRARIKICQKDIHLGYYHSFEEVVQARNVGMECMFGEFGIYNDVPEAPQWIRDRVTEKCSRFAHLSVCEAFALLEAVDSIQRNRKNY